MKLLLDTHILFWALTDPKKLSNHTREQITSSENLAYVSLISPWELQIKETTGKLRLPDNLFEEIEIVGFELLPISLNHIKTLRYLPLIHRDPFDRMLVAQAQCEQMTLVTRDQEILKYEVTFLHS